MLSGGLQHPGILQLILNGTTINQGLMLFSAQEGLSPLVPSNAAFPLLDYPGWKQTHVFCFQRPTGAVDPILYSWTMAHQSVYLGLGTSYTPSSSVVPLRPPIFLGLRYDTDPGASVAITSIAAHSGSTTAYSCSSSTTAGALRGNLVTVKGATSPANNGTFLCTASTATTVTLANPNGVLQAGSAGTMTTPAISDTTFQFEYVANPISPNTNRNNTQGQVYNTGISPVEGQWYRLDMESTAVGVVTLTLSSNGSQLATWTVTCTTVLWGTTTASSGGCASGNGAVLLSPATTNDGTNVVYSPFSIGSQMLLGGTAPTGMTVGNTYTNAGDYSTQAECILFITGVTTGSTGYTLTGYPALLPWLSLCTDSATGHVAYSTALNLDFFGFVWNPGLAGAAVNTGNSRFFSGT